MKLYAAYGSNLDKDAMLRRAPDAVPAGKVVLNNWRLVFRSVADITPAEGFKVHIGLWQISDDDEEALDRYEGIASDLYFKRTLKLRDGREALVYIMNRTGIMPPTASYFRTIERGYQDFEMPIRRLEEAVLHSYREERLTRKMVAHHERRFEKETRKWL